MMLIARVGWGKRVETQPRNFKGKYNGMTGEAVVALSGPIANFLVRVYSFSDYASYQSL